MEKENLEAKETIDLLLRLTVLGVTKVTFNKDSYYKLLELLGNCDLVEPFLAQAVAHGKGFYIKTPPFETFKNPTCKGCLVLGTACLKCEKCKWELDNYPEEIRKMRLNQPKVSLMEAKAQTDRIMSAINK